jgi:hypothetical protein
LLFRVRTTVVPVPVAFWMFGSELFGFIEISRKKSLELINTQD